MIGDGVGTNQVFFGANDLFDQASGGNFTPLGAQDFAVDVLGPNQSDLTALFTLNFAANFTVAQTTSATVGNEFFAVYVQEIKKSNQSSVLMRTVKTCRVRPTEQDL